MRQAGAARVFALVLAGCAALCGCVTQRAALAPLPEPWERRLLELQQAASWQLDGRAAVAVGTQGWQASLTWTERGTDAEVHLAGPLGVGAVVVKKSAAGLSLNGGAPTDAVLGQLQERLGFDLPLVELRYWLLGVPDPQSASETVLNDQNRAQRVTQQGWSITYERYLPASGDWLPARLVLVRDTVRVRIAVDHWQAPR